MINTEAMDPAFYQWGKHESNQEVTLNSLNATSSQNSTWLQLYLLPPLWDLPENASTPREEKPP